MSIFTESASALTLISPETTSDPYTLKISEDSIASSTIITNLWENKQKFIQDPNHPDFSDLLMPGQSIPVNYYATFSIVTDIMEPEDMLDIKLVIKTKNETIYYQNSLASKYTKEDLEKMPEQTRQELSNSLLHYQVDFQEFREPGVILMSLSYGGQLSKISTFYEQSSSEYAQITLTDLKWPIGFSCFNYELTEQIYQEIGANVNILAEEELVKNLFLQRYPDGRLAYDVGYLYILSDIPTNLEIRTMDGQLIRISKDFWKYDDILKKYHMAFTTQNTAITINPIDSSLDIISCTSNILISNYTEPDRCWYKLLGEKSGAIVLKEK